ncbi:ATP-binding cassette domain-containing protein [uncultured Maribacter sp.]|uniref:ATP-binding cassette domain-containing protein n=1 Tax=uncultured Maribacter sp. TaxID=431308 RepID=UPI002613520F|nr:ATP-binding cassette domain-containing protein [uncultured Maribacter sp.]
MRKTQHWAIFTNNESNKNLLAKRLLKKGRYKGFTPFTSTKISLFSKITIERFIDEEDRHDEKILTKGFKQALKTLSSGEQKKALLQYLFNKNTEAIILDNPFDNLDSNSQKNLKETLSEKAKTISFIQIISRKEDLLPFITNYAFLEKETLNTYSSFKEINIPNKNTKFLGTIPPPIKPSNYTEKTLIQLKNVNVSFEDKKVLQNINWTIERGSFWQLIGSNGSGKTTLLSMITGENPKGYGQELFLFGRKKGTGESIWDIKKRIGYFTPAMTDKFRGYHTVEQMIISGFNDSIGLYVKPSATQKKLAKEWLSLINMWHLHDSLYNELSMGQKRLVMTTRAMVKHPDLLILDEATAGLDDASAHLLISFVNKIASDSETAIIFVSHRSERGLNPAYRFVLNPSSNGSLGTIQPS